MDVGKIVAQIDSEIAKLQQAKALLASAMLPSVKSGRGRPKGSSGVPKRSAPL